MSPRRNLALLIGAGASYGAGHIWPEPPPLGDALYPWLRARFPGTWGAVAGGLDSGFRENFELGMHDAWTQHSGEAQFLLIDMGRAFARFRPPVDGSDNYSTLIRCLMTNQLLDRIAIASLNYECILEGAADRLGVEVGYGSGGRPANSLVVLKPHGSCNLFPPDSMVKFTRVRMVNTHIYYDGPLEWVYLDDVELRYAAHETMPSAMCLYAPGKHAPVAPSWVEQVRQAWRAVASSADAVAVIGVRPVWEDAHVWDPVIESGADVWYIGDDLSYAALANKVAGQITHLGRTFDEGIGPLCRLVDSFS